MSEDHDMNRKETCDVDAARTSFPTLNKGRYVPMVEHMDITDEQADELLQTIWNIMCGFVGLGFGDNSIQKILPAVFGDFSEVAENQVQSEHPKKIVSTGKSGGADEARH